MHIRLDVLALALTVLLGSVLAAYVVSQHPAAGPPILTALGVITTATTLTGLALTTR